MRLISLVCFYILLSFSVNVAFAQNVDLESYLSTIASENGLSNSDIADYKINNEHTSNRSGISHFYYRQRINGIEIFETQSSIHLLPDGSLFKYNNAFYPDIDQKIGNNTAGLSNEDIISRVITEFAYDSNSFPQQIESSTDADKESLYSGGSVSQVAIPMKLMYYMDDTETLQLCYDLSIYELDQTDWWSLKVDANTGEIVSQINWVVECNFDHDASGHHTCNSNEHCDKYDNKAKTYSASAVNPDSYHVYAEPVESPSHGSRTLEINPADVLASPFGWHDTDGSAGAESTQTRGNNVNAQEDENGNNGTGYAPDGSNSLDFDFPIDFNLAPEDNRDASLTNLFYWNNLIHDVLYQYGFDEAAGNFQENNYGNGGQDGDRVNADGLDGSGTNNANFATPTDGGNPRMQMFLWSPGATSSTSINTPNDISGAITGIPANFGPAIFDLTGDIVLADDGTASPTEACSPIINGASMSGNIALIDRGNCEFGTKSLNAQDAGAVGVIICQNTAEAPFAMAPGDDGGAVTIPAIMISRQDCDTIKAYLPGVNLSMEASSTGQEIDGSFDNGIIVHEYGHGISNRLTGGGGNTGCLSNTEQMGEGWSDWYGMLMTIEPGDVGSDGRGVGTYALTQPVTGGGIRDYPYSTDLGIDPRTYDDIKTASVPHGVGSVWCAMLWEMTWALIDNYGYDPDLHYGTGGNNMALALVTEGLKLQPCSPGFVDGRDAIIAADAALYGGQNECLIWAAFAKRGLGDGASQGNSNSRSDGVESFIAPTSCEILDITKTADATSIIAGDTLTYTLKFDNQTSTAYTNFIISDTIRECMTYIAGSATGGATFNNGVIELTVPTVSTFSTVEVQFQVKVDADITSATQDFIDDAENGNDLWFTYSLLPNNEAWKIDNTNPYTGASNWFAENTLVRGNTELVTKTPKKLTATSELRFWHTYNSLSTLDGGRVEISIDNKATWVDLDTYFTQNGYDDYITMDPNIPAFGGTNNTGYVETIADLSSFAGEYVHFRFTMFFTDNAPGFGWRIDDISVTNIEKSVANTAYFTANSGLIETRDIFPGIDIIPATCSDGIQNGTETGIDTGGNCTTSGPCEFDLVLSDNPAPGDITYQVENQITSTANVGPNTNYFGSTILLENEFEVIMGNEFLAEINPCTPFTNDNEVSLKVIHTNQVNNQYQILVDINIPETENYILQVVYKNDTVQIIPAQELKKGVHRITIKTEQFMAPQRVSVLKAE